MTSELGGQEVNGAKRVATWRRREFSIKLWHVSAMEGQTIPGFISLVGMRQLVTIVAAAILLGVGLIYLGRPEHKYRLTIEVQTPDGVKSASGVMAVYMGKDSGILPGVGGGTNTKGDAIFVDLGGGRNLIVTLTHGKNGSYFDGMNFLAMNAFAAAGQKVPFKQVSRLTGKVEVHDNLIPMLVTFGNVADPSTVRVLDPTDIGAVFGDGFRLNRVILEMVPVGLWPLDFGGPLGEPVTRGIESKLPWVTSFKGYLSGNFLCNPSKELCLEVGNFRRK